MTYFMERTGVDRVPGAENLTFGHGDTAECHAEPPTCGCTEQIEVAAREVRDGDRVLDEDGEFVVYHAMTTGKKARITSLKSSPLADPRHYPADHRLTIERRFA